MDASRRALGKAATAADKALSGLYTAAEAHDALVVQTAAELRTAGLTASYEDAGALVEFTTGGTRDGVVPRHLVDAAGPAAHGPPVPVEGAMRAVGDRTAEAERLRVAKLDLVGRGLLPDLPAAFWAPVPAWRERSLRRTGRR